MKRILLLMFASLLTMGIHAQNLLENGGFESWTNDTPDAWKSANSASSATLEQSTDAYAGQYAVLVKGASGNKRLGSKEMTLEAGEYQLSFYAKALTEGGQARPGYAPFTLAEGKYTMGDYVYGSYANLSVSDWTKVTYDFTLSANTDLNIVVMNPKGKGDILIDEVSLVLTKKLDEKPQVDISNTPETAYTVAKAIELINAGEGLDKPVYVKGIITSIKEVSTQYGNATFDIKDAVSDDAPAVTVYRCKDFNNQKITDENVIKLNDEIIVYGTLKLFGSTPEVTNGYFYSVNGTSTAIEAVAADKAQQQVIFNLAGQRINQLQKGINILGGKKVLVK